MIDDDPGDACQCAICRRAREIRRGELRMIDDLNVPDPKGEEAGCLWAIIACIGFWVLFGWGGYFISYWLNN